MIIKISFSYVIVLIWVLCFFIVLTAMHLLQMHAPYVPRYMGMKYAGLYCAHVFSKSYKSNLPKYFTGRLQCIN